LEVSIADRAEGHSTCSVLLGQLRVEDSESWRKFSELYTPLVYNWARKSNLQPADAEDVTQEVFRVVARRLSDYEPTASRTSFRAWLWGITRNMLRRHFDAVNKHPPSRGGSSAYQRITQAPDIIDSALPPMDRDAQKGFVFRVLRMIRNDFEESTWQAFWRTTVENETATDVGRDLAMTAKAVRQAKYRVLCRVRQEISD
tara:strand:+ start:16948 stop:17550 length:603 start_codon:yes stop_codon:yes gene_type:complete